MSLLLLLSVPVVRYLTWPAPWNLDTLSLPLSVSPVALLAGWGGTHWDEFHLLWGCVCAIYGLKYHRAICSSFVHCEMHGGRGSREWSCLFSPLAVALCQYHSYRGGQRRKACSVFPVKYTVFWESACSEKKEEKNKPKQNSNNKKPRNNNNKKPTQNQKPKTKQNKPLNQPNKKAHNFCRKNWRDLRTFWTKSDWAGLFSS